MKERDRLVEQTLAFVQGVAAAHPDALARPAVSEFAISEPAPAEVAVVGAAVATPSATAAPVPPEAPPAPMPSAAADAVPVTPPQPARIRVARQPEPVRRPPPMRALPSIASERAAIVARVAAFRAHQDRLIRERETYYATVQAKIRDVLGNEL
jgi:hypothetical protein